MKTGIAFVLAAAFLGLQSTAADHPCAAAIARGIVCEGASEYARRTLEQSGRTAALAVQDVRSGALVAVAASTPRTLDVNTAVLPLSFMKVFLAASWLDRAMPDRTFDCRRQNDGRPRIVRMSLFEMLVSGCDLPGRQAAVALRSTAGGAAMIADLQRFTQAEPASLPGTALDDAAWGDTWSLGEQHITLTLLQLSQFLQAVGNRGVAIRAAARERLMQPRTAARLTSAMIAAVRRGTAKGSDADLRRTRWTIGGKTGSGPLRAHQELDGLFAGLILDPSGTPRFTVVTLVRQGGYGGGQAARISARVARYLIDGR